MIVKICGITRLEDAELAVELGATAVGFIFWPKSPRCVSSAAARSIVEQLPGPILPVGVFVDAGVDEMESIASEVGLGAVQLHGSEPRAVASRLTRRVIKGVGLAGPDADVQITAWAGTTLLLDAHDPERRGGTGRTVDWDRAAGVARRHDVILSGGLTPENVAEAVRRVRPGGIDVSSGVERSPGIKDAARLAALFEALAGVEV